MVAGYVCGNFLATASDKNRCHICREPKSAHTEVNAKRTEIAVEPEIIDEEIHFSPGDINDNY